MRAIGLLAALLAVTTQGCAAAVKNIGTPYGTNFGEIRSDRPSVADELRGGQTNIGSFGTNPTHRSVPQNIPLPAKANPRGQFVMPQLGERTVNRVFQTAGFVILVLCALPDPFDAPDRGCEARTQRDFERDVPRPVAQKGPVILR